MRGSAASTRRALALVPNTALVFIVGVVRFIAAAFATTMHPKTDTPLNPKITAPAQLGRVPSRALAVQAAIRLPRSPTAGTNPAPSAPSPCGLCLFYCCAVGRIV